MKGKCGVFASSIPAGCQVWNVGRVCTHLCVCVCCQRRTEEERRKESYLSACLPSQSELQDSYSLCLLKPVSDLFRVSRGLQQRRSSEHASAWIQFQSLFHFPCSLTPLFVIRSVSIIRSDTPVLLFVSHFTEGKFTAFWSSLRSILMYNNNVYCAHCSINPRISRIMDELGMVEGVSNLRNMQ